MRLFEKYHHEKIYKLFHSEFWMFERAIWLHVFARSMIAVFIPIFLLKVGMSVSEVILYYIAYNVFDFPLNFLAKWLVWKIGARRVIIIGTLASIAFFAALSGITLGNWPLIFFMAFLAAIYDTSYWVGHIYLFMKCNAGDDNLSEEMSYLYIAKRVAGVLAPIFGALILIFFSKNVLIATSIVILFLSLVPLFRMKHTHDRPTKKPMGLRKFFAKGYLVREYAAYGIYSFHSVAEGKIWPIFIFVLFGTLQSVAVLPIIVSVTAVLFTWFAGRIKKAERSRLMALGALLVGLTWILRLAIDASGFYYFSVFLMGLFAVLVTLPLDSTALEKGEKRDPLAASAYRNAATMFPRIFYFGALYLMLDVFQASFITAALAMFVFMLVSFFFLKSSPAHPKTA